MHLNRLYWYGLKDVIKAVDDDDVARFEFIIQAFQGHHGLDAITDEIEEIIMAEIYHRYLKPKIKTFQQRKRAAYLVPVPTAAPPAPAPPPKLPPSKDCGRPYTRNFALCSSDCLRCCGIMEALCSGEFVEYDE